MRTHEENKIYWREYHKKRREDPLEREKDNERRRKYRLANREKVLAYGRKHEQTRRWKRYGVTQEIWDTQFQKQGCACAICGTYESGSKDWHTDHNHATNTFRGVLCHHCNLLLGHAKDNPWILEQAIQYLKDTQ